MTQLSTGWPPFSSYMSQYSISQHTKKYHKLQLS